MKEQNYYQIMEDLCKLQIINLEGYSKQNNIDAILGFTVTQSSFKAILGFGILLLAKEQGFLQEGQPIIESTSGSLGVALAWSARILGHPLHIVVDSACNPFTLKKMSLMGANIIMAEDGNFQGGYQEAREITLLKTLKKNPHFYNVDQHHNPLNPEVYQRWLTPYLESIIDFSKISAGIFCVGTGGHFVALANMLKKHNIPSYVAEIVGSITFGGKSTSSIIRGAGNQLYVPKVIGNNMHLVKDVIRIEEDESIDALKKLSISGIFVGGTSGMCYAGANKLADKLNNNKKILTFFGDKGELYWESLYKNL